MKSRIVWLRVSYWTGAIVDAKAALLLWFPGLFPGLFALVFGPVVDPSPAFRSLQRAYAILILGWTCLLIWADRRPLERKGVLMLTLVPIVTGLVGLRVYNALGGQAQPETLPFTVFLAALGVLFGTSWYLNRTGH